jgi:hypothetical protein
MKHAEVAGVRGVHIFGTPNPLEDIWDTRSDGESLHAIRNSQQLIDGMGIEIGRDVIQPPSIKAVLDQPRSREPLWDQSKQARCNVFKAPIRKPTIYPEESGGAITQHRGGCSFKYFRHQRWHSDVELFPRPRGLHATQPKPTGPERNIHPPKV